MAAERHAGAASRRRDRWSASTGQAARWAAVNLDLRAPQTWFGPSWALLSGVVSSGLLRLQVRSLVILAIAWLVGDALLGSLLALSIEIAKVRSASRVEILDSREWRVPYMQPGSPAARMLARLRRRAAAFAAGWQISQGAGGRWAFLALMVLVLAAVAGGRVLLMTAGVVVGLFVVAAGRPVGSETRQILGALHVFVAWVIGHVAFGGPDVRPIIVGALFAVIWYAWTQRPPLSLLLAILHLMLAGLLVLWEAPLTAGGVLLLAVPLFVLQPDSPSNQRTYLPQTQAFLMVCMLLAAWGLGWGF